MDTHSQSMSLPDIGAEASTLVIGRMPVLPGCHTFEEQGCLTRKIINADFKARLPTHGGGRLICGGGVAYARLPLRLLLCLAEFEACFGVIRRLI